MTAPIDNLSIVAGDTSLPLIEDTIGQVFAATVRQNADRDAAIFCAQNIRLSYAELTRQVDQLAGGLVQLGLVKGDRIGIWSPNRLEWLLTMLASARLGLILVNINPAYRVTELEFALNKVGCKALVTARLFKSSDYVEMLQRLAPELNASPTGDLHAAKLPELRTIIQMSDDDVAGMLRFQDVMASGKDTAVDQIDAISAGLEANEPINIQFTSGTTGSPKGATLTHRNIINNAQVLADIIALGPEDRLAIPVPLYHCFGMVMGALACLNTGAAMVFPSEVFDPTSTLKAVEAERCTALYGVPTMFVAELEHPEFSKFDFSSLRTGIMAGSPCPIEIMRRVVSEMNMRDVTIAYGMTETSPVSFQSNTDDPIEKRVSTVGRVHPHVEAKIVDEEGQIVPVGSNGEICTRGYLVMTGYWDDAERSQDAIDEDGWMHTGDLGCFDNEGYLNIVGRVKDMVIRGGENLFPKEIEDFLYRHPKIQAVQVFGVPDERYGEELCAWIILKPGESADETEIKAFCADQISHFKIPRYIRFVDDLPLTVTGKPQKFKMRVAMIEELELRELKTA